MSASGVSHVAFLENATVRQHLAPATSDATACATGSLKALAFKVLRTVELRQPVRQTVRQIVARPPKKDPPICRTVTPLMLQRFKLGRAWLLARLPELLAAGWTRAELFHVGKLAWPWQWGIAWLSAWGDLATTASLDLDGSIRWTIRELHREVVQTSRPQGGATCAS